MRNNILYRMFAFSLAMLIARLLKTGHYSFLFMLWNLFLAWLPLWFMKKYKQTASPRKYVLLCLAILFLPNAPYMTTDLFHLTKNLVAPLWLDTVLLLNFAVMGLILFVIVLSEILDECRQIFSSSRVISSIKALLVTACAYGIYLGRYLRFNSWDLFTCPKFLFSRMYQSVFDADFCRETLAITATFTVFLYLILECYEIYVRRTPQAEARLPE